jgi:hypothetical protein
MTTRRARVLAWLGRRLAGFGATLAAVPDPQGQFPATPLLWHLPERQPRVPEQADGPPLGHPEKRATP